MKMRAIAEADKSRDFIRTMFVLFFFIFLSRAIKSLIIERALVIDKNSRLRPPHMNREKSSFPSM